MLGMQVLDIERGDARIDALQPVQRKLLKTIATLCTPAPTKFPSAKRINFSTRKTRGKRLNVRKLRTELHGRTRMCSEMPLPINKSNVNDPALPFAVSLIEDLRYCAGARV
jgi:hypothetical protein